MKDLLTLAGIAILLGTIIGIAWGVASVLQGVFVMTFIRLVS